MSFKDNWIKMRSICKNCKFSREDGKDTFCVKRMTYVHADSQCKRFELADDKGDADSVIFTAFLITIVVVGFLLTVIVNTR